MNNIIERHLEILRYLHNSKSRIRKYFITYGSNDLIHALGELALNILKGILKTAPHQIDKFVKLKPVLKLLSKKNVSIRKKRSVLLEHLKLVHMLIDPLFHVPVKQESHKTDTVETTGDKTAPLQTKLVTEGETKTSHSVSGAESKPNNTDNTTDLDTDTDMKVQNE